MLAFLLGQNPPSPAALLKRVQSAYDSAKTFEQSVTGVTSGSKATATISFARPGKLRVKGTSLFGSPYDLVCDGKTTMLLNAGSWKPVESSDMGIATITGVSGNAGTMVPATLTNARFGGLNLLRPSSMVSKAVTVGGKKLWLLEQAKPFASYFWIDPKTNLLAKSEMTVGQTTITVTYGPAKVNQSIPASRFRR